MKKLLLFILLLTFSLGFSQGAAPTPPARVATDVISVFSGAYTDVGTDFYPNWGQGTQYLQVDLDPSAAVDDAIRYTNLDYQGMQFNTPIDALTPAMTHLHIDIWTPDITSFEVFLIAGGENSMVLTPTLSGWNSYDIPLTHYSNAGRTLNNIIQFKFTKTGFIYQGENNTVYIDNLYFWKAPPGPGAAPIPPTRLASDVISVFSGAYADVGTDFYPNWGQGTQYAQVDLDYTNAVNNAIRYTNLDYQGMQFNTPIDAVNPQAMTHLHIDIWTPDITSFEVFLIAGGENSMVLTPTLSGWNSYDIPLTHYSNAGRTLNNIIQFKFTKTGFIYQGEINTVYIDNLYFWKPAASGNAPTITGFSIPTQDVGTAPFTVTAPTSNSAGAFSYMSSNSSVATITPLGLITIVGAGTTTITATQEAAGIYSSGVITTVLEVKPPGAPSPNIGSANAIRYYTNDLTSQPAAIVDTYRTVWSQGDLTNDLLSVTNNTLRYNNMNFVGMETIANPINASAMNLIHLDIWTPNMTTFRVKLVDLGANAVFGGGDDVEHELSITPTLSGWNSLNFLLSSFTGLTTKAAIGQLIISGNPAGAGTVYVDNIYFSDEIILVAPTLTNFSVSGKEVGDTPFMVSPPNSPSSGAFSYMSSNGSVATITPSGLITVIGAGTTIITATQAAAGSYLGATINTNFEVTVPPATAAPTPTRLASDVISLFSNAYTDVSGTDWYPNWGQTTQYQQKQVLGDDVKRYSNFNYEGVQFSSNLDVSSMTTLHIDVWTTNCTALKIYLIPGGAASNVDVFPTLLGWNSFDIPLSSFNLTPDQLNGVNGVNQFKFDSTPFGSGNVYIDNVYFWRPSSTVNLTLFMEGYYTGSGSMASVKLNQDGVSPPDEVENITVELHDATTYALVETTTATLKTDGTAVCNFPSAPSGSFYIAVKTSNAIQTWSKTPQTVSSVVPLSYNFSTAASQAYGDNMIETVDTGVWAFYSGDLNQDEVVDGSDAPSLSNDIENSAFGVQVTDINGDGAVDGSDAPFFENNSANSIFASYPF